MKILLGVLILFFFNSCAHYRYSPSGPQEAQELMGDWIMEKPTYFHLEGQDMSVKIGVGFSDSKMRITSECAIEKVGAADSVSVESKIKILTNHRIDVLESLEISKGFKAPEKLSDKPKKQKTKTKKEDSPIYTCRASSGKGIINYVIKENKLIFLDAEGREDVIFIRTTKK
jgi:hypothetical protein